MNLMKHLLVGLTILFLTLMAAMALVRPSSEASPRTPQSAGNPVVVELFTSEGCSSCPPADALLARLADERLPGNVQLIALEEHVDYWNDLGWMDPFSSREWTSRQYVYSGILKNGNPYTPQMVVDGALEFVGSRTQQARESILKAASKTKVPATLIQVKTEGPGKGNFSAKVGKLEGRSVACHYGNGIALRRNTGRERRRRPPPCRRGALHAEDRRSQGRRRNILRRRHKRFPAERVETREPEGGTSRAGKKEPADSWSDGNSPRAISLWRVRSGLEI